ncbi:MAG TPA: histidine kinase dimerization/phospho-acceptor domain-containing protein, partial [Archangium sp.]|nr:histidine kinase dimerization/phospho-acceptor domain-containing protein [Archangium sp.]
MKRTLPIWLALAACVALACGALAWLSLTTVRLERAEAKARADALVEERVRLALWRMDGRLARLIAQESTRAVDAWAPFYVPLRAFDEAGAAREPSATRIASTLLFGTPEGVRLHFTFTGAGPLGSPQVPGQAQDPLALAAGVSPWQVEEYGALLSELETKLDRKVLLSLEPGAPSAEAVISPPRGVIEFERRMSQAAMNAAFPEPEGELPLTKLGAHDRGVKVSPMVPVWMGEELLLVRRVEHPRGEVEMQGAWLDWPRIRTLLLEEVKDLLPGASLVRVEAGAGDLLERRLASLPVRLVPGPLQLEVGRGAPVAWSLGVAWGAVLLALVAVGFLLFGALSLSERRAAFVSAVTHELRTPLTTFRMYAEMLAEGMVTDAAQRQGYYETLHRESNRLAHLVENVLAYARLERKRAPREAEPVELGSLLRDNLHRCEERAREAGMQLVLELVEALEAARVLEETSSAEQVLFILFDNAG